MSTTTPSAPPERRARALPWWGFGLANVVIVLVLSVLVWWLLVDPEWSPIGSYPQPFNALLFWSVISVVFVTFNCGWTGPARPAQPGRGLTAVVVTLLMSAAIVSALAFGWGAVDPTFAASRPDGAGFTAGQLIVLFAFFFYVTAAINWMHWPWAGRLEQPWVGLATIGMLVLPTLAVYGVLALPNVATWADRATVLISAPTLIGWFYSVIVSVVVTGLLWDNLPWSLAGSPGRVTAVSFVGNLLFGTVIYYAVGGLARLLMGSANVAALGDGVTQYAAQLGVCWVFWMIAWANVFGNRPTRLGTAANLAIRLVATLALGVVTFLAYYFFAADVVLHEPAAGATMHGNALGFMDLAVLLTLYYVIYLESFGLPRAEPDAAAADEETIAVETGATHV
ncbi:hypothetical protein [Actinomycetospora chiangmaiensis]|uniref:hypothetical protein n=1 Tax=Actinomycetospora chiangmaiensis TaxID=402650 RepID=UPI00036ACAD7|nr:hypothetical protein [Actinomycetospora chiangmaiensis]